MRKYRVCIEMQAAIRSSVYLQRSDTRALPRYEGELKKVRRAFGAVADRSVSGHGLVQSWHSGRIIGLSSLHKLPATAAAKVEGQSQD